MQTRTALRHMSGTQANWGDGPLGQIADKLLSAFRTREADRLERAGIASTMMGTGPMLAALQRRFAEVEQQSLFDVSMPMVTRFEAYQTLRDAASATPGDLGLKRCAAHCQMLWQREPDGTLAVGDVERLRAHWTREFPKSRVGRVLTTDLLKVGFNTLPVGKLAQMAADIRGHSEDELHASYEGVVRAHGLDGTRPEQIRARAFLCGLVNLSVDATTEHAPAPGGAAAADRVLMRMAAFDDPILRNAQLGDGMDEMPVDEMSETGAEALGAEAPMDGHEDEIPHDEGAGTITEIQSPITGEPLALELELQSGDTGDSTDDEGMVDDMGEGDEGGLDIAPEEVDGLQHFGQLADFAGDEEPETPGLEMPDFGGEAEAEDGGVPMLDEGEGESAALIEDPSAPGEMLEVTVKSVGGGDGDGEGGPVAPVSSSVPMEGGGGSLGAAASRRRARARTFFVYAVRGGVRGDEPIDVIEALSMPRALRQVAASLGEVGSTGGEVRAPAQGFERAALIVLDAEAGNHLYVVAKDGGNTKMLTPKTAASTSAPVSTAPSPSNGTRVSGPLSVESARTICASIGLEASQIEARLLDAEIVSAAGYTIRITDGGEVELATASGSGRRASMENLDLVIADFMAFVAAKTGTQALGQPSTVTAGTRAGGAQLPSTGRVASYEARQLFSVGCVKCGGIGEYVMPDAAADVSCESCAFVTTAAAVSIQLEARQAAAFPGYVVITDVPAVEQGDLTTNARRIMAAIQQVCPHAEGSLRQDSRLEVTMRPAGDAEVNRIRRVLEDRFGVQAMEARKTAQAAQHQQTIIPEAVSKDVAAPISNMPVSQVPGAPAPLGTPPIQPMVPGQQSKAPVLSPSQTGIGGQQQMVMDNQMVPAKPGQPGVQARRRAAHAAPIFEVVYRDVDGRAKTLPVEAQSEEAARRIFAMYDGDCQILQVQAQFAEPVEPQMPIMPGGGGGAAEAAPPPAEDPGAAAAVDPTSGGMGGMNSAGGIRPEVQEAIRAAMMTLRNSGVDVATAVRDFQTQFKRVLERFGDETSPARQKLGAEIIKAAQEAWSKPALLDLTASKRQGGNWDIGAEDLHDFIMNVEGLYNEFMELARRPHSNRHGFAELAEQAIQMYAEQSPGHQIVTDPYELAEYLAQQATGDDEEINEAVGGDKLGQKMPSSFKSTQGPAVNVGKPNKVLGPDSSAGHGKVGPGKIKPQQKPKGKMSPTDMGGGEEDLHPAVMKQKKPPANGQYGLVGNGTSLPSTDLGSDSLNSSNATTKKWDSVSKGAPAGVRSK